MKLKTIKVSKQLEGVIGTPSPFHFPPFFSVDGEQMPEIKKWDVRKKYRLVIEVEQTSKSQRDDKTNASFDIVAYKHLPEKSIDDMTDEEFGEYQDKSLAKGELA